MAKKKTRWIDGQKLKGACLNVTLPKTGLVRILFVSDGRKDWQMLLRTDIDLEPAKIIEYYARRWSIEVYFKDAKQLLYMGKDQSNKFDALVAANSLVMIRYLLIVYILSKRRLEGPIGPLFRQESDKQTFLVFAKAIWDNVKELIFRSSDILSYQIDLDVLFHVIDIIKNTDDFSSPSGVLTLCKISPKVYITPPKLTRNIQMTNVGFQPAMNKNMNPETYVPNIPRLRKPRILGLLAKENIVVQNTVMNRMINNGMCINSPIEFPFILTPA